MNETTKRVAIFTPQLSAVGTEGAMLGIANGLPKDRFEVDLVAAGTEWARNRDFEPGVRLRRILPFGFVSRLPARGFIFKISITIVLLLTIPLLAIYLRRNRPDFLLVGLLPLAAVLAVGLARTHTPIVISVQGLPRESGMRNRLWRWMAGRAATWVTPADPISERLRSMTGRDVRTFVITNPVLDMERFNANIPVPNHPWYHENSEGDSKRIVLGAGRLTRQKNFEHLLTTFAKLSAGDDVRLVIVGEGEERGMLERLAEELGITDRVSMPGYVTDPEAYMAHADVFVLTSRWEGPGHVLIEALATGVPCVTVDCPSGPSEILGGGKFGKVVPVEDVQALATAIDETLADPESAREQASLAGPGLKQYTAAEVGALYGEMLDSLTDAKSA